MMTREEALARIKMNPNMVPAGQDPEAFISAMMAADAANAPPPTPPVPLSPAAPAPVQAGVPIEAPPPMAPPMPQMATDFRNQAILAANQTKPPGGDLISGEEGDDVLMGKAGKGTPPPPPPPPPLPVPLKLTRTPEEMQTLVQGNIDAIKNARNAATVPQEVQKYFDASSQRTDAELADVDKERKQQYWMSLALAGAKMAQSKSPYFASALAEGMESGLTGFNKARAEASEKKARLQTRKEDMILKRYETLKGEQDRAVNDIAAGNKLTADRLALANASDEQMFNAATSTTRFDTLRDAAKTAKVGADYAERNAQADLESKGATTAANRAQAGYYGAQSDKLRSDIARAKTAGNIDAPTASMVDSYMASADHFMDAANKAGRRDPTLANDMRARAKEFYDLARKFTPILGEPTAATPAPTKPAIPPRPKDAVKRLR